MFKITEKEATGEVTEIYQDIRETMNMPFPQTIWRNLATKEGAIQSLCQEYNRAYKGS